MQGVQAHVAEVGGAAVAFVEAGEDWIWSRISALEGRSSGLTLAAAEAFGGLAFGGEVLGLDALVHQPGGFEGDRLAKSASDILSCADIQPIRAARGLI